MDDADYVSETVGALDVCEAPNERDNSNVVWQAERRSGFGFARSRGKLESRWDY